MKYFILSVLDTLFTIGCRLLINWWAPLFCDDKGYLPRCLKWVGTFDDTLDAGIRDKVKGFTEGSRYWNRVRWLNRNPGYGFGYFCLGIPWVEEDWSVVSFTKEPFDFYAKDTKGHYNKHFIWHGIRIKIGYKAWNMYDSDKGQWKQESWGPDKVIPFAFSISRAK